MVYTSILVVKTVYMPIIQNLRYLSVLQCILPCFRDYTKFIDLWYISVLVPYSQYMLVSCVKRLTINLFQLHNNVHKLTNVVNKEE